MEAGVQGAEQRTLRVVLAEPNEMMRAALRSLLAADQRFMLAGEALVGVPALAHRLRPDLIVVGAGPNGRVDSQLVVELGGASPGSGVVALADSTDIGAFLDVMIAGARGYLLRTSLTEVLVREILVWVGRFQVYVTDAGLAPGFSNRSGALLLIARQPPAKLPQRERVVLQWLASGAKDEEIAAELGISRSTVRDDVQRLCARFGVHTRFQLGVAAARLGFLQE